MEGCAVRRAVSVRQDMGKAFGRFKKESGKRFLEIGFFLAVMALTFRAVFAGQDAGELTAALRRMDPAGMALAVALGMVFICMEGLMLRILLRTMGQKSGLLKCIGYSFVGFFYSGITPSASGGQPMQLYYMKKDGNRLGDSAVALMVAALCYKLALVCIGAGLLLGRYGMLRERMGGYFGFYVLGMVLNTLLVALILGVMLFPQIMTGMIAGAERGCVRAGLLKPKRERMEKVCRFVESYRDAVAFLKKHPGKLCLVMMLTFVQRSTVFILTWVVYWGMGLDGTDALTVIFLQAAVYIAVDMLPVPGAQGITELMYVQVFGRIFVGGTLTASMLICRSANFYMPMLVSLIVSAAAQLCARRDKNAGKAAGALSTSFGSRAAR